MTKYAINTELNGIEIAFDSKPGEIIREELKAAGFRWHRVKKVWYAKNSADRLNLAQRLTDAATVTRQEAAAKEAATAWTVERLNSIKDGYTFKQTGEGLYSGWTGCHNGDLYGQELKKAILAELKKNGFKATARERSSCYHTAFIFTVKVPAEMIDTCRDRVEPVKAFEDTVKAIVSSFNSDHSNSMIDYFDRGFYDSYKWIAA